MNKNKRWILFLLVLAFSTISNFAQSAVRLPEKVDEYMNAAVKGEYFSGSILIAKNGKAIISKGYGPANYELDVPNTPKTIFQIASLTKAFTAVSVMQLQEKGRLSISDPICEYLENCPEGWQPITIRHLLTHTSGIPNYTSLPDYEKNAAVIATNEEIVQRIKDKPLDFAPGEKYKYNNSGYRMLGMIIEKCSGISYGEYLRENIFTPLEMKNSGFDSGRKILKNRAAGYALDDDLVINAKAVDPVNVFSEGGIYSTVEDLLLWDQSLYTEKLLSKKSLGEIFTPEKNNYGYGWNITKLFDRREISHSGQNFGFASHIKRFPDDRMTIIVLSNNQMTDAQTIATNLAAIVFGEPYRIPRVAITVDSRILEQYAGTYEMSATETVKVTLEAGKLFAQGTGQGKSRIYPLSETKFFVKNSPVEITFEKDAANRVVTMSLWKNGSQKKFPRKPL
jgi:CubicO group peptidase (beta-lactamase class C family)